MKQELKDALEWLALGLAADATKLLSDAQHGSVHRGDAALAAKLASAAAACASEVEWASGGESEEAKDAYEELKALVVPLAECFASWPDQSEKSEADVRYYGMLREHAVTYGQMRRLCRALGMEVPDAPA